MRNGISKAIPRKTAIVSTLILITMLSSAALEAWTLFPRTVFEATSFEGKIVDAETGLPIPNAVVYINWPRMTSTFGGSNPIGTVEVQEAISNSSGYYKMPGWKKSKKEAGKGWFSKSRPEMVIYASGYWPELLHNRISSDNYLARNEAWKSDWDGKTIKLKPMHSEKWQYKQWKKYGDNIGLVLSYYFIPECGWLKLPNYYLANDRIRRKAYVLAHPAWDHSDMNTELFDMLIRSRLLLKKVCGVDPKAFFLSHGMSNDEFEACCSDDPTKRKPYKINHPTSQTAEFIIRTTPPEAVNSSGDKK